jgi:hypothetical protein
MFLLPWIFLSLVLHIHLMGVSGLKKKYPHCQKWASMVTIKVALQCGIIV